MEFKKVRASERTINRRKLVYGVGVNDAWYFTYRTKGGEKSWCQVYQRWVGIISRAYSEKMKATNSTYRECTVCEKWLTFSVFAKWHDKNYTSGMHIDKDIKIPGNSHYSPETCLFVPMSLNNLFRYNSSTKRLLPRGVTQKTNASKYRASISINGRNIVIGSYDTPEEAHLAYLSKRDDVLTDAAGMYPEISQYILGHLTKKQ